MLFRLVKFGLPMALALGITSAFYIQLPLKPSLVVCLLVLPWTWLVYQARRVLAFVVLVVATFATGNLVSQEQLSRQLKKQPKPEDLNRSYKITGRVLYQWDTEFGTAIRVDQIEVLSPVEVSWRLSSLNIYLPTLEKSISPRSKVTLWMKLKRRWGSKPIPKPMQDLREQYMPARAGSVKSLKLIEWESPPKVKETNLSNGNRELIDLFTLGIPSFTWRERLAPFGLGHLLAFSGLHCLFVFLLIQVLILPLKSPLIRIVLSCFGLLAFASWVGWPVSVTRASMMMVVWQVLPLWNRPKQWLRLWAGLLLLTLVLDPLSFLLRGFWYSFAASLGIILGALPRESSPLNHPYIRHLRLVLPIFSAQCFVIPINLVFDPFTNLTSFFWNLFGFFALLLLFVLFLIALISSALPFLAPFANKLETLFVSLLDPWRDQGVQLELVRFPFEPLLVMAWLSLLMLFLIHGAREYRWYLTLLTLGCLLVFNRPLSGERLWMVDVGQGLCVVYVSHEGKTTLFDAGGRLPQGTRLPHVVKLLGGKEIEHVFISHHNADHYNLLERFPPLELMVPSMQMPHFSANEMLTKHSFSPAQQGQQFLLGRRGEVVATVLWPPQDISAPNQNEESLVLRLGSRHWNMLLTGDAGKWMESRINRESIAGVRILQAGHHGSRTATSASFLKQSGPQAVLISCGKENRFNHPHPSVTSTIEKQGVDFLVTGESGTILIMERGKLVLETWSD